MEAGLEPSSSRQPLFPAGLPCQHEFAALKNFAQGEALSQILITPVYIHPAHRVEITPQRLPDPIRVVDEPAFLSYLSGMAQVPVIALLEFAAGSLTQPLWRLPSLSSLRPCTKE